MRKFCDAVINRAFARIGQSFFLKALDQADHVFDVVGGANELFRNFQMQSVHVLEKCLDVFFGVLADAHSGGRGLLDDAIVHVR